MKDANNRDAVVGEAEINHMPFDIAAAIARSNMITRRSGLRRFSQDLEGRSQQVGVALSLLWSPLTDACISRWLPSPAWGAGESRYSAIHATEPTLEGVCIEALWLSAFFTLDQGRANLLDLCATLLFSPNKITDVFAIVGVVATFDLRLDPVILLIRQRNSLADSRHNDPVRNAPIV